MDIIECENSGVIGWKCGENGTCHIGIEAKQRAIRDQKRLKAAEWKENPKPLPAKKAKVKNNKKIETNYKEIRLAR